MSGRARRLAAQRAEESFQVDSVATDENDPDYNPDSPTDANDIDWRYKASHLTTSQILDATYQDEYVLVWEPLSDLCGYSDDQIELDNALEVIEAEKRAKNVTDDREIREDVMKYFFKG